MTRPATLSQAEIARAIKAADLVALAKAWRDRPPSGRYILHGIPRNWWCPTHGPVTKWHECCWEKPAGERPRILKM